MTKGQLSLPDNSCFTPILERIREETSKILKIPLERYFTDHSIEGHSSRILQHLYGLTHGLRNPLCEEEEYILIASAYLHDVSLAWKTDMNFLTLRKNHPKLSSNLIRRIAKGEQISGIQCDFGLPQRTSQYAMHTEYIARVVEGHGGTKPDGDFEDVVLNNSKVRVRFLADLLAFADELDVHRARVDLTRLAQSKMPEADIFHWWKHWFVIGVKVENLGTVQISYAFPEDMRTNHEFPDLVQRYVKLRLEREYEKVEPTLAQEGVILHIAPATKDFTDIAAPGEERPSPSIVNLFRNAVSDMLPSTQRVTEPDELIRNIELATQYLMVGMLPAVVGHGLYVRRRESEECFEEFVENAPEQVFLLAGRPGTGKSMFIMRMINKYPTFSLVYSYAGDTWPIGDLPQHVVEQYASIIANKLQAKKHRELDIRRLEEIAKSKGKCVILYIESNLSLNNLCEPNGLLHRLAQTISERNIKVCMSCVADVGEIFNVPDKFARMIYQPPSRMGVMAPSSVLGDYSEEEFANACLRYFGERKVNLSEADLKDEARDRLKHPLWLDIYSMARAEYPRTKIETSIRYVEVCESFLNNRSRKVANILTLIDGETLIQLCLNKMAMKLISTLNFPLDRSTVEELILSVFASKSPSPGSIQEAMRMAGLIKESFDNRRPEGRIRFAFEEIREYLVARESALENLFWTHELSAETIRNQFSEILCEGEKKFNSIYETGVLEFLILLLEHAVRKELPLVLDLPNIDIQIVDQLLGDLISSGLERGEQVCARVLGKLDQSPVRLLFFLEKLSKSQHQSVRRDLTYSLSALSRETQESGINARGILSNLLGDRSESVACCAVAALIKSFEKELVPPDWVKRFIVICDSPRRELVTTMTREFGRRTFLNTKEFLPAILKSLCLRENSDPQIAAVACDCLSKTWTQFAEDALAIVCGVIKRFSNTRNEDIVMRQAVPALISMEPWFQKEVSHFFVEMVKLKRYESLKSEIARNHRKFSSENRQQLLGILEKDDSPYVRALVFTAINT
jgi:hypothetical protein